MREAPQLAGWQIRHLRGLAHALKPVVWIGKEGVSESLLAAIEVALDHHELIKLKFNDLKEEKKEWLATIAETLRGETIGLIGHTAILYRQQEDPRKRVITLPSSPPVRKPPVRK